MKRFHITGFASKEFAVIVEAFNEFQAIEVAQKWAITKGYTKADEKYGCVCKPA